MYLTVLVLYTIVSIIYAFKSSQTLTDKIATVFFGDPGSSIIYAYKKIKADHILQVIEKHNK